jgi:hypothetical protein
LDKRSECVVFVNPSLRRPSVLRSMLPAFLSSAYGRTNSGTRICDTYNGENGSKKAQ